MNTKEKLKDCGLLNYNFTKRSKESNRKKLKDRKKSGKLKRMLLKWKKRDYHLGNLEGFLPKGMGEVNEIKKLSYISRMQGATKSDFKLF